jgi:molybdopterin synthase sulfur carrier subunit
MKVQVKLFATLGRYAGRDKLPGTPFEVELAEGAALDDLLRQLNLPAEEVKLCFVNARMEELDFILQNGDEVGIFPPIGGG